MIFDHKVKFNGVLYETGQDVPIKSENVKAVEVKTDTAEKPTKTLFGIEDEDVGEEREVRRRGRPKKG